MLGVLCSGLTLLVLAADVLAPRELSFSLFYLVPILLAGWYGNLGLGLAFALGAALLRSAFDLHATMAGSTWLQAGWRFGSHALLQGLFAVLVSQLKAQVLRAHQANRAKSMFLANMSHEIRTPLNSVLALSELLDQSPLNPQQKSWVGLFRKEGQHLLALLNDLLDFSKIEAKRYNVRIEEFSLSALLEEVRSVMGVLAAENGLELRVTLAPNLPVRVSTDAHALRRVLFNLVGNAIKFTPSGYVALEVELQGDRLCLRVVDTGSGIPPDQLDSIFEPFVQAEDTRSVNIGGTGLGLSIVRELLVLLGGSIQVSSRVGEGSAFQILLPLQRLSSPEVPSREPPKPASAAPTETLNLLIADDYPLNRLILREFLKELPCRVTEVEDGEQAVQAVKSQTFSLVLLDLKMPVLDGAGAVRAIRSWEKKAGKPPVPIVALTAQSFDDDVERSLAAGFQAHVAKPIDRATLLATVLRWARPARDRLTARYLADVRSFQAQAVTALEVGDVVALESLGHRLKGTGGSFGFPELTEIGADLETAAQGPLELLRAAVEKLMSFNAGQEAPHD